jgi:hypothetical protein
MNTRTCSTCHRLFTTDRPRQRHCSTACRERMLGRAPRANAGTTAQRGYGADHQRLRKRWAPLVERGEVSCWRCGLPIDPGENWHLGHHDEDRSIEARPEHAERCNLAAAGRKANAQRRRGTSSEPRIAG